MFVTKKTLQADFEIKSVSENGSFAGYGSVFGNKDRGGDVIERGAFEESLKVWKAKGRLPAMLWQHDAREPIGVYTEMKEDEHGLYVEGKLAVKTEKGAQAYELLKLGGLSGLSIGYNLKRYEIDEEQEVLIIKEVDLWEVSLVTFPMNDEARIDKVKHLLQVGEMPTERDFEKFLREAGFSKKQSKAIVADGFKAAVNIFNCNNNNNNEIETSRRDAEEVKEGLSGLIQLLKGNVENGRNKENN